MAQTADVVLLDRILHSGLMEQAEKLLLKKLDYGNEGSFEKLGNIYRQQGKLSQAAGIFDLWAERFPQSNKARYLSDLFNQRPLSVAWTAGRFVPTPFLVRDDFLPPAFHAEFIRFVIESRDGFKPSRLLEKHDGEWKSNHYPELHNSSCINLTSPLKERFLAEIAEFLPSIGKQDYAQNCKAGAPFLLHHGNGNFFASHVDKYDTEKPGISLVYLFSGTGKRFAGGSNVFYDTDLENNACDSNSFTLLPFADNRLVAFPGKHYHGVLPVRCDNGQFESGRFSLVTFFEA